MKVGLGIDDSRYMYSQSAPEPERMPVSEQKVSLKHRFNGL